MTARPQWIDSGVADQGAAGVLPKKVIGEHRWIMLAVYTVTHEQAKALDGEQRTGIPLDEPILFDNANRMGVDGPGCIDCEMPFRTVHKNRCPSRGYDYHRGRR